MRVRRRSKLYTLLDFRGYECGEYWRIHSRQKESRKCPSSCRGQDFKFTNMDVATLQRLHVLLEKFRRETTNAAFQRIDGKDKFTSVWKSSHITMTWYTSHKRWNFTECYASRNFRSIYSPQSIISATFFLSRRTLRCTSLFYNKTPTRCADLHPHPSLSSSPHLNPPPRFRSQLGFVTSFQNVADNFIRPRDKDTFPSFPKDKILFSFEVSYPQGFNSIANSSSQNASKFQGSQPGSPVYVSESIFTLHLFQQNCRSWRARVDALNLTALAQRHHAIYISEIWLNDKILNCLLPELYFTFRRDRDRGASLKSTGGKVLIAIKHPLRAKPIFSSSYSPYDWVVVHSVLCILPLYLRLSPEWKIV